MTPLLMKVAAGDGVELAVYRWDYAPDRPTLVLVHGYPDNAAVWERCARLLGARYNVVSYDLRGAGRSSRPRRDEAYRLERLVADLDAVISAVSPARAVHLVGHDWGSVLGWEALATPAVAARIASFTSLSGPGLAYIGRWLRERLRSGSPRAVATALRQLASSLYVGLLQVPGLPAATWKGGLARRWPARLRRREGIRCEPSATQTEDGIEGARLYRANRRGLAGPAPAVVQTPVQLVVARRDDYLHPALFDDIPRLAPQLVRREIDGGHWLPLSHPRALARWIAEFVDSVEGRAQTLALDAARAAPARQGRPLSGRLALITGAGSGFGRETALLFAEQGADLILVDIDGPALERSAELVRLLGAPVWTRRSDVGSAEAMEALAAWVGEQFGALDILVNNAGIAMAGSFFDTRPEDWERLLRVNLWGVIHGARLFGRQMLDLGRGGQIVNVASAGAFLPLRFLPAYNTSKAAVLMLSDCLRGELADRRIGVSAICPGFSSTNITRTTRFVGASDEQQERQREATARLYEKRNLPPRAIAQAILDAVLHNEPEVAVGVEAHAARLITRLAPALRRRIARLRPPR